jgi:hypothetical protein
MNDTILHYDGTNWSTMVVSGGSVRPNFYDVWGSGPNDVFAVGEFPATSGGGEIAPTTKTTAILHHAGNTSGAIWTNMPTGIVNGQTLHSVWGSGPNDVFAVGTGATVLHYNGSTWSKQTMPNGTADLYGVWGKASNDVYAVDSVGLLYHYDGASWSRDNQVGDPNNPNPMTAIGGNSRASAPMFIVGDLGWIQRRSDSTWSRISLGAIRNNVLLTGVWVDPWDNAYIVGDGGMILFYRESGLSQMKSNTGQDLWGVWGGQRSSGGTPDVFAVGDSGTVLRYEMPPLDLCGSGSCGAGTASLMPLMILQLYRRKTRLRTSRSRRR